MKLNIVFVKAEEWGYCAFIAGIDWINGQWESIEEAKNDAISAYALMVSSDIEDAKNIPDSFIKSYAIA